MYDLTATQVKNVLDVLNGVEGTLLDMDAAKAMLNVSGALGRMLVTQNIGLRQKNGTLKRQVERMQDRMKKNEQILIQEDAFDCTGLDSVDVGKAMLYQLQQTGAYLSKDKFVCIVYLFYCSWLYHNKKRLFLEQPKAIEQGPRFWRMHNEIASVVNRVDVADWNRLAAGNPELAGYIRSYAVKYCNYFETDLQKYVLQSEPFRNAMENARKNGKKSWSISDKDIFFWKEENAQNKG